MLGRSSQQRFLIEVTRTNGRNNTPVSYWYCCRVSLTNAEDIRETEASPAIWTELMPKCLHLPDSGLPSSEELHIAIPMFVDRIQGFINHVLKKLEEKRKENEN